MWIIDSNSHLELVVLDSPILSICWIAVGKLGVPSNHIQVLIFNDNMILYIITTYALRCG